MSTLEFTLPDGSVISHESPVCGLDIASAIGPGLAKAALALKLDGETLDLATVLPNNGAIEIITKKSPEALEIMRHSCAHVMADAVTQLYPEVKLGYGPAIENGFYYDFDLEHRLTDDDLLVIEDKMREIAKALLPFQRRDLDGKEAAQSMREKGQSYKVETLEELADAAISFYQHGDFADLCRGPHVPDTSRIGVFKLTSVAGAYWKGDERNPMLQRIYGTAFADKKALREHLELLEEAKKRDHRKLGKELKIFIFDEDVGPGLPLWLPNGTVIIDELEALAKETETDAGYMRVRTPHITKGNLYHTSGHLPYYAESMFPPMEIDGIAYYIKPMNCPHHHKIFASSPRSYRDMPIRLAEYGTCYRYEKSGELFGLMRVRSMQMNDAHIYCTPEQFREEFLAVCRMYRYYFDIFGVEKYQMRLSLHDPADLGGKYVDEPELWIQTEKEVRAALIDGEIPFVEVPGEAAFYGPKIDVQIWSAIGREFTLATNQVDFAVPRKFGLSYVNAEGQEQTPLCIHRAPLSTHERFIGFLIEHYGGDFPLWLAPVQVKALPITDRQSAYANEICQALKAVGIRAQVDLRSEKIGYKIRDAELQKIPYMVIIGDRESASQQITVRKRKEGDLGTQSLEVFIDKIKSDSHARI